MTHASVRSATVEDAEAIGSVHAVSSDEAYGPLARDYQATPAEERARFWRALLARAQSDPRRVDLVAEAHGDVIGFLSAGPARRQDVGADLEVYVIHVLPEQRGRGVGRQLWAEGCGRLRGVELPSMLVETYAQLRCCTFYEARGGRVVERVPDVYDGGEVTRVVYHWARGVPG